MELYESHMEFTLHRQLKAIYGTEQGETEVRCQTYRIDAVRDNQLIEVQLGSLAAIRNKIARLLEDHPVTVVRPLVCQKYLVKLNEKQGEVLQRRLSPKAQTPLDLFEELVYFVRVFPHPQLTLEVPLVRVDEHRYPGHGRRRRWRESDFQVQDQFLREIDSTLVLRSARDLWDMLQLNWTHPFDTDQLAKALKVPRWSGQRIAYCLRETGAVKVVGKHGNSWVYEVKKKSRSKPVLATCLSRGGRENEVVGSPQLKLRSNETARPKKNRQTQKKAA